jgi:hypothetical protein
VLGFTVPKRGRHLQVVLVKTRSLERTVRQKFKLAEAILSDAIIYAGMTERGSAMRNSLVVLGTISRACPIET